MAALISGYQDQSGRPKPTYSTTVRSPDYFVVLQFEILVKHGGIQLDFAVELVAHLLPVGSGFRHGYSRGIMAVGGWIVTLLRRCKVEARLRESWSSARALMSKDQAREGINGG